MHILVNHTIAHPRNSDSSLFVHNIRNSSVNLGFNFDQNDIILIFLYIVVHDMGNYFWEFLAFPPCAFWDTCIFKMAATMGQKFDIFSKTCSESLDHLNEKFPMQFQFLRA